MNQLSFESMGKALPRTFTREQTIRTLMREHGLTKFEVQDRIDEFERMVAERKAARAVEEPYDPADRMETR